MMVVVSLYTLSGIRVAFAALDVEFGADAEPGMVELTRVDVGAGMDEETGMAEEDAGMLEEAGCSAAVDAVSVSCQRASGGDECTCRGCHFTL